VRYDRYEEANAEAAQGRRSDQYHVHGRDDAMAVFVVGVVVFCAAALLYIFHEAGTITFPWERGRRG